MSVESLTSECVCVTPDAHPAVRAPGFVTPNTLASGRRSEISPASTASSSVESSILIGQNKGGVDSFTITAALTLAPHERLEKRV